MSWIDAHCHLSDLRVAADLERMLDECARAGISRFILGGVDPGDWQRQRELDARHPGTFLKVFGLHPWHVHDLAMESAPGQARGTIDRQLKELESQLADCTALGETGLDGARNRMKGSREEQLYAYEAQLELARKYAKPLVLHVVRAHADALARLERQSQGWERGGLVHSFSGTWADAHRYLDLGFTLSVSARLTHPDAHELREIVGKAPVDRLVFETDAPDQPPYAPDAAGGRLHTPLSLLKVVDEVSKIRGESSNIWLDRSRDNLLRIFKI